MINSNCWLKETEKLKKKFNWFTKRYTNFNFNTETETKENRILQLIENDNSSPYKENGILDVRVHVNKSTI